MSMSLRFYRVFIVGGLLFFLPALGQTFAESFQIHWEIDTSFQGFLTRQKPLDLKWQNEAETSLVFRFLFPESRKNTAFFLTLQGRGRFRFQSDISKGYLYTGFQGFSTGLGAGLFLGRGIPTGRLLWRPGFSLEIQGGLYFDTTGSNYRFFPSLTLEPLVKSSRIGGGKNWQLGIKAGLPVTWDIRPDMELSLGFGLRLGLAISPYNGSKS